MRRSAFTLIELMVAITLSGIVLLSARALWESLASSVDRLRTRATADTRDANGERLLRSLIGRLEVGTDASHEISGDARRFQFSTWCDAAAGWQERCNAVLSIEADSADDLRLVARLSTGEVIVVRRGFQVGSFSYLRPPIDSGAWYRTWPKGIPAPMAIRVIADSDALCVRVGDRG